MALRSSGRFSAPRREDSGAATDRQTDRQIEPAPLDPGDGRAAPAAKVGSPRPRRVPGTWSGWAAWRRRALRAVGAERTREAGAAPRACGRRPGPGGTPSPSPAGPRGAESTRALAHTPPLQSMPDARDGTSYTESSEAAGVSGVLAGKVRATMSQTWLRIGIAWGFVFLKKPGALETPV